MNRATGNSSLRAPADRCPQSLDVSSHLSKAMQGNVSHNAETLSYGSCASSTSSPRPPSKFIQSHAPIALKILCHVQLAVVCDSLQHLPQRQKASEIPGSSLCATNNLVQAFFGTSEVRLKALVLKPRWLSSSADGHDSSMHCKLSASSGLLSCTKLCNTHRLDSHSPSEY